MMTSNVLEQLEQNLEKDKIHSIAKGLHDSYNPFLLDIQVWELLKNLFPIEVYTSVLEPLRKTVVGHKIVNQIVMSTYFGEKKVKYHIAKKYINRESEISVFEMNVGTSRLDFARINGKSHAYEIKTELDSLDKLEKQIIDYSKVFEYIHVITHKSHYEKVLKIVPDYCSIITYRPNKEECLFHSKRAGKRNVLIDSGEQLSALTTKELETILKKYGIGAIPQPRADREELILSILDKASINKWFKIIIKKRFEKRWTFLCNNFSQIEPIDIQSFFKSTANPYWIYYKNSSMV